MKSKAILCIISMALLSCFETFSGPPWVKYNVGYNYIFRGIDFPANQESIGFMAGESLTYNGDGIVLKTVDGGNSWSPVWTGVNCGLEGACFVDVNTGYVAGWPKTSSNWSGVGKTTDGGATWTSLPVPGSIYFFTDVVFKDANNGIVVGATNSTPVVYATSNGGSSWVSASGVSGNFPQHACHVSGNTYFLTDNGGNIKKSTDNGLTWTTVHTIPGLYILGIKFYNDMIGMACGDNGVIITTSNGGVTWQNQQVGTDLWHDFGWESQDRVFCCGTPEIIAESDNGGASWFNGFPQSTYQAALYECVFTVSGKGFICGSQGTLLKRNPSCTAAFTASSTGICAGDQVNFSSQSTGNVSTYEWLFPGGTPGTSNSSDPVVTYASPGTYDVRLIVNNGFWSDTLLKSAYIHVSQVNAPVISVAGTLLSSSVAAGNQWFLNGSAISGATGQSYQATMTGWYRDVVTVNGCSSDSSNSIYIVMAGHEEMGDLSLKLSCRERTGDIILTVRNSREVLDAALFDLEGKEIRKGRLENAGSSEQCLEFKSLEPGLYVVMLKGTSEVYTQKVLIYR